jgi:hypothetical protein
VRLVQKASSSCHLVVEAMGLEPTNLLTASQALYQLSYAPVGGFTLPSALVRCSSTVKALPGTDAVGP